MSIQLSVQAALSRNDVNEAVCLLASAAEAGDEFAAFELGRWFLSGRPVARDLTKARDYFGKAAAGGHARSQMIYAAFLAGGIGGPRRWNDALSQLERSSGHNAEAAREISLLARMAIDEDGNPTSTPGTERVSHSPGILWVRSLFTADECEALVAIAEPFLNQSVVVDPVTRQLRPDPVRTSDAAMFPWADETPFIHTLNRRLAAATGTASEQGEPLQVLRYQPGQEYRSHSDALPQTDNQRVMTALVYLNADYDGGETYFPAAHLKLRGDIGDALIFYNTDAHGRADPRATHAGRPVTRGVKWLASRWIREKPYGR